MLKNLQFLACLLGLLLVHQVNFAQAPPGYTLCASEGQSFTLPAKSHIAYGTNNRFKYMFNQTGTVTFSPTFFDGDPVFASGKQGYYKLAPGTETPAVLSAAIKKIKNHLTGVATLSAAQINIEAKIIEQNIFVITDTSSVLLEAFDLVDSYESLVGPLFMNSATSAGFANNFFGADGFEIHRAVFLLQQGMIDHV